MVLLVSLMLAPFCLKAMMLVVSMSLVPGLCLCELRLRKPTCYMCQESAFKWRRVTILIKTFVTIDALRKLMSSILTK